MYTESHPDLSQDQGIVPFRNEVGLCTNVSWKRIEPSPRESKDRPMGTTILIPGWNMDTSTPPINFLGQEYANVFHSDCYLASTTSEDESIADDVRALHHFLSLRGLRDITLIGHSEGGLKAANLAVLVEKENEKLEEDKRIHVKLVVLLAPVGLTDHGKTQGSARIGLAGKFSLDSMVTALPHTIYDLIKHPGLRTKAKKQRVLPNILQAASSITKNTIRDATDASILLYPERLANQIDEMSLKQDFSSLKTPILLMQGVHDPVSKMSDIDRELNDSSASSLQYQIPVGPREHPQEPIQPVNAREQILHKIFPKSPYIRAIQVDKLGHHPFPFLRSNSVAQASAYFANKANSHMKQW